MANDVNNTKPVEQVKKTLFKVPSPAKASRMSAEEVKKTNGAIIKAIFEKALLKAGELDKKTVDKSKLTDGMKRGCLKRFADRGNKLSEERNATISRFRNRMKNVCDTRRHGRQNNAVDGNKT